MSRTLTVTIPLALAAALIATTGTAEPNAEVVGPTTQLLADSCAVCHGTDGNSPGSIGELDDMELAKFTEKMKKYKYQEGKGRIMGPIARGISDDQIQALAEHFQTFNR